MKKQHTMAFVLALLAGLALGTVAFAAEHGGDPVESDSSSAQASESSHDSDAKGDEHAGEAADSKSGDMDHDSGSEHAGESASGDDS